MSYDPVFGKCHLSPLCLAFFRAPEHCRLAQIAMNHANIRFQGLHYSRREHCVAVMELARRWATVLVQTDATDEPCARARLVDLVALAGLYHDVGHVTLSHAMDHLVCALGVADHETRSLQVVRRVNRTLGLLAPVEEQFVCDAIAGQVGATYPPWAYQIVHQPNREWPDVDRLVYLVHDSSKLGLATGIEIPFLTARLELTPGRHLCFRGECADQLALIRDVRSHLFRTVFHHVHVQDYQTLLVTLFCDLFGLTRLLACFQTEDWLTLTDTVLWSTLLQDPDSARRIAEA